MKREIIEYNAALQSLQLKLKDLIQELNEKKLPLFGPLVEESCDRAVGNVLTPESKINTENSVPGDPNQKPALKWYKEFMEVKEGEIGKGINSYRTTWDHFRKFVKENDSLMLIDLNRERLNDFRKYLSKIGHDGTTIHKQFKNLRIFLNWIKENEEDEDNIKIPSAYKRLKVKARYGDPIGLTVKQFLEFYTKD